MPDLVARFRAARTDPALAVLEGFHAIKHAIRFGAAFESLAANDLVALRSLTTALAPDVTPAIERLASLVTPEIFARLSPTPPETGVIAIAAQSSASIAEIAASVSPAPIVLLESPSHSGNIGAVVRVAAAAGAAAVVTTGTVDPWNPGALRGSAGLHYAVPVVRVPALDLAGRPLIAFDPDGEDLEPGAIPDRAVLAFGSERAGLSAELLSKSHARIRIPMRPGVSSLNLATSVAVALYQWKAGR